MKYETRINPHNTCPEYQVHKPLTAGYRCDALADAAYLEHVLNNLTPEQEIAACEAATNARGRVENAA